MCTGCNVKFNHPKLRMARGFQNPRRYMPHVFGLYFAAGGDNFESDRPQQLGAAYDTAETNSVRQCYKTQRNPHETNQHRIRDRIAADCVTGN